MQPKGITLNDIGNAISPIISARWAHEYIDNHV